MKEIYSSSCKRLWSGLNKTEQEVKDTKKNWKKEVKDIKADFAVKEKKLKAEIKDLKAELKTVKEENIELKKKISELENEESKLRSQSNNNSSNSSLPPSTDQKGTKKQKKANEYNGRTKSGRNVGGQDGHTGKTLKASYIREKIEAGDLERIIVDIGEESEKYEIRYVIDYEIKPIVKELRFHADKNGKINIPAEYRNKVVYGNVIKAICVYLYSEGVVANDRICDFVNALCKGEIKLSKGSVYNMIKSFSNKCDAEIEEIEKAVLYNCMSSKSIEAIKEHTILGKYKGILVHDHKTAMYNFGAGHGECNAHLLRYLKKNTEETDNKWSIELTELLIDMNDNKK